MNGLRSFDRVGDQARQMIVIDRLDEVMVEPVLQCVHRAIRSTVGRQGEQQHAAPLRLLANPPRNLVAVEARTTDVNDPW